MKLFALVGDDHEAAVLAARLVRVLGARGLTVSVAWLTPGALALDRPGKDSHRHRAAGAREVWLQSSARWAHIGETDPRGWDPERALRRMSDADLVLVLGQAAPRLPALAVIGSRGEAAASRGAIAESQAVMALAVPSADRFVHGASLPVMVLDKPEPIGDFILRHAAPARRP